MTTIAARGGPTSVLHRNHVELTGDLAAPAQDRVLADGSTVTTFRLAVRAADAGKEPAPVERLDCVAVVPALRRRVLAASEGDVFEVVGVLRHRYWRAGAALADRYEVVVSAVRRVRRAGP